MAKDLKAALLGTPKAPTQAFPGARVMQVTKLDARGTHVSFRRNLSYSIGPCHGELAVGRAVGDVVLVILVDGAISNPWIVAVEP